MADYYFQIHSDQLQVEVAQPGTIYQGTRFDWSGFVTQVTLDGNHTFCVPESLQPGQGTGGIGICNEFGNDLPVGYDETKPGESFPKLGIGLLKREDDLPYNFFKPYQITQPFPIQIQKQENRVTFRVEPVDVNGYAVRLTKTLSVNGRTLHIIYHLENVGSKPIVTNEYVHNFIGIDGHAVGPDYRLRLPYPVQFEKMDTRLMRGMAPKWMRKLPGGILDMLLGNRVKQMTSGLLTNGNDITFKETPKKDFYARLQGFRNTDTAQWEIAHLPSGVGLREFDDFTPLRFAIWGVAHVFSAEVFAGIDLQPGQSQQWLRRFEFFAGDV
jgi:hypothetical protein